LIGQTWAINLASSSLLERTTSHIYRIQDDGGSIHEGKDEVASVLLKCYKNMLGKQMVARANSLSNVVQAGPMLIVQLQIHMCRSFSRD